MTSIIIPTMRTRDNLIQMITDIERTRKTDGDIIVTGLKASAAINRNMGLNQSKADIIIMLDDDMTGFYDGWDIDLLKPLIDINNMIISARLKNPNGTWFDTIGDIKDYTSEIVQTKDNIIPSCCIAFKKTHIRFNEAYQGSGFEDTSWVLRMSKEYKGKVVINNKCILIHKNEKKNNENFFSINREIFRKEFNLSHEETYRFH